MLNAVAAGWVMVAATPGLVPVPLVQRVGLAVTAGACSADGRLDARDVQLFVDCYLGGGAGCWCWDLNDSRVLDAADVSLLVGAVLDEEPFAVADRFVTPVSASLNGNVLANDLDPFGPGTTAVLESLPGHGGLGFLASGAFSYTPAAGYAGTDSFTYRAVSARGASQPAAVHLVMCSAVVADCDGNPVNGCETDLHTLTNCGGCGVPCTLNNAVATCATGACGIEQCNDGFGNCDGNPANGCEASTQTLTNCGGCGTACSLANASESCSTGTCLLTSCNLGFDNCDSNQSNGCEVSHVATVGSCALPSDVGSACGDDRSGIFCPSAGFQTFATRMGQGQAWFRGRASECSDCCGFIQARVILQVPAGINFDLYGYSGCGVPMASSTNAAGVTEQVDLFRSDDCGGAENGFDYWIEVRFVFGEFMCELDSVIRGAELGGGIRGGDAG